MIWGSNYGLIVKNKTIQSNKGLVCQLQIN